MAILPKSFMEATVVLGSIQKPSQVSWFATGFIVGRYEGVDEKGQKKYTTYLVTNKHVVEGQTSLQMQFNSANGISINTTTLKKGRLRLYSEHPDPEVDIIANRININGAMENGAIVSFFQLDDQALGKASMKQTGVEEGSLVYSLGFPVSLANDLVDSINKAPVCRLGCVSRIEHLYHNNNAKFYIIDAPVYPGNSGGPIINRPEMISIQGTPVNSTANLIGIVSAYIPYRENLMSTQTGRIRMVNEENSGLTVVFPVDDIKEVVELERTRSTGIQSGQKMEGLN